MQDFEIVEILLEHSADISPVNENFQEIKSKGMIKPDNHSTATANQVLTKTADGYEWKDAQGGGGEPAQYVKNVTKAKSGDNTVYTFTRKDNTSEVLEVAESSTGRPLDEFEGVPASMKYTASVVSGLNGRVTDVEADIEDINDDIDGLTDDVAGLSETKQNTLVSGTNIKTINNQSILGSGNIDVGGGGAGLYDEFFEAPVNFGAASGGVIGNNVKIYTDIFGERMLVKGSGATYSGTDINDANLNLIKNGAKKVLIGEGITTLGYYLFNRYAMPSNDINKYNVSSGSWEQVGYADTVLVLPKTVSNAGYRTFQYQEFFRKIVFNCDGELTVSGDVMTGAHFASINIPNATILNASGNSFNLGTLVELLFGSATCKIKSNISFSNCNKLTNASLVDIANHLKPLEAGETLTITLHATPKAALSTIMGTVSEGVFTASTSGTVSLLSFINDTKGWTVA